MATSTGLALITGANRGIGRIVAEKLTKSGFDVLVACRTRASAETVKAELGAQVIPVEMDVGNPASVSSGFETVEAALKDSGRTLDVLINNAAILTERGIWTEAAFDAHMQVNWTGLLNVTMAALPLMSEGGSIINVSSMLGSKAAQPPGYADEVFACRTVDELKAACKFDGSIPASGFCPVYSVTKAKVNRFTQLLSTSDALTSRGIRVNSVCPGWCTTEMGGTDAARSPDQGADSIMWLVDHPEAGTGGFFRDGKPLEW